MRIHLNRPISILLSMIMVISLFAIVPITTAGAAAETDDPWIFAANDGRTYDLDGKWVRFGDEDFQLSGTGEFTLTNRTTYIYQLKYGNTHIADSRNTQAGAIHIGNTFYVTGRGTEDHPYIFTPNMIFYKTGGTIANGGTVAAGYENYGALPNTNNGVAVPGDGLKGASRILVGSGSSVEFAEHNGQYYQPSDKYIGVSEAKQYGWKISSSSISSGYGFDFASGNDTLYYMGKDSSDVYHFSETPSMKTNFSGTNKVICTVNWENQDGTHLKTMTYNLGDTPDDGGLTPSKAEDAAYTYDFSGFEPAYEPLTDDMTYVATYNATPKGPMTYSVNAWIFSTNNGMVYDELEGMCYSYNGGETTAFLTGGSFSVSNNQILLCDVVVADIDTSKSYKTFANTVYVTGDGSQEDPFVFHPNYIYADTTKSQVKDGVAISIDSLHTGTGDKGIANPGDGFRAMSKIRVGNAQVQFMQKVGYYSASRNLLGVGETTYGYRYSKTKALPFSFVSNDNTLYYYEKTDGGIYQFSETKPPLRYSFRPSSSTIHTVTWKNYDGSLLGEETYYVGVTPSYKGSGPRREREGSTVYTLTGWYDGTTEYSIGNLPAVTEDVTYYATFSGADRELFKGYTLTLKGDIGLNFWLDVTDDEVADEGVTVDFNWTVKGEEKSASYTITSDDKREAMHSDDPQWYKATCWLPAAEMNYDITATVTIGEDEQEEVNRYNIKSYSEYVLSHPDEFNNDEDLFNLVSAMLDYGAKAQTLFNRTDVPLANAGITYSMIDIDAQTIPAQLSDMKSGVSAYGLEYYGTTVIFLSKTTLRHYYKASGTVSAEVKAAAAACGYEYGERQGYVYFQKKDISAKDLDAVQPISFDGETYYDFSVLDYSRQVLTSSNMTTADRKLAMATYWYNYYANLYLSN